MYSVVVCGLREPAHVLGFMLAELGTSGSVDERGTERVQATNKSTAADAAHASYPSRTMGSMDLNIK